jgi:cob(I)alamin adenosyltransferase
MKKAKIYTKTGDTGETGLVSGSRLPKSDLRIDLYGELDELNSRLGFACSEMAEKIELQQTIEFIHHVQSAIFDLGSNLACEEEHRKNYQLAQIQDQLISDIELEIDKLDAELEPLKNFILPGGSKISSLVHLCRTHTRTVERKAILYRNTTGEELPENCLKFLNRLSDYFFILARNCNRITKTDEIL